MDKLDYLVYMNKHNRLLAWLKDYKNYPLCHRPSITIINALHDSLLHIDLKKLTEEQFDAYQLVTLAYHGEQRQGGLNQ